MLNDDLNRNDLNRDNMRLNQDPLTPNHPDEGMSFRVDDADRCGCRNGRFVYVGSVERTARC